MNRVEQVIIYQCYSSKNTNKNKNINKCNLSCSGDCIAFENDIEIWRCSKLRQFTKLRRVGK